jgi:hypothetical protein
MKYSLLLSTFLVTGCMSVPITQTFPNVPENLKTSCTPLEVIPNAAKMSDIITIVSKNYGEYHNCNAKVEAWNEWYTKQKKIYDEVKK